METWYLILFAVLILSMFLALIRIIIGPTLPDRVIALDIIAYILIALLSVFLVYTKETIYLDVILALTLVAFFGTVFIALYLKKSF